MAGHTTTVSPIHYSKTRWKLRPECLFTSSYSDIPCSFAAAGKAAPQGRAEAWQEQKWAEPGARRGGPSTWHLHCSFPAPRLQRATPQRYRADTRHVCSEHQGTYVPTSRGKKYRTTRKYDSILRKTKASICFGTSLPPRKSTAVLGGYTPSEMQP